jgi:hypothetical protein
MIVVLFVLLTGAAIAQLAIRSPATPHPGPTRPGQLPPGLTQTPTSTP